MKKNVKNINEPEITNKFEVKKDLERTDPTDEVDRSGYIPVNLQYARMMAAGRKKEDMLNYQYNADYYDLVKAIDEKKVTIDDLLKNQVYGRRMEKTELVDALRTKIESYSDARKEYHARMDEFYRLEREKQVRQDAINAYKAEMEKQANSTQ